MHLASGRRQLEPNRPGQSHVTAGKRDERLPHGRERLGGAGKLADLGLEEDARAQRISASAPRARSTSEESLK